MGKIANTPQPPAHLSPAAREWWASIMRSYVLESHHIELLGLAAGALDRAEQARAIIERDGLVQVDRFQQAKPHPAVQIERDSKVIFARLCRELGLDLAPADAQPGRPGRKPKPE